MYVFGFSINALTLFGLVLAIGIVVDDAIVVVENVERNIEDGPVAARGDLPAMREVSGPDHRHRAGAGRGVRAARLHQRPDRPVLQAVRADHRDLDGDLGDQLADAVAGAGRAAAQGARRAEGRADARHGPAVRLVLPRLQPRLPARRRRLQRRRAARHLAQGAGDGRLPRAGRRHRRPVQGGARRLRAGAGQAVSGRLRAAARRRHARPHRGRDPPHERHRAQAAGRRAARSPSRACRSTASPTARTPGIVFVDAEALRRAQERRT